MLARIRKAQESEGGFTLIELLVVMIIIGILAAIAIPVFLNQRKKAQDSAAKADVSTLGKEIATYYVDGIGSDTDGKPVVSIDTTAASTTLGHYVLNVGAVTGPPSAVAIANSDLGKASANNKLDKQFFSSSTAWCVSLTNAKGDRAVTGYKYSAANGLSEGLCASAAG